MIPVSQLGCNSARERYKEREWAKDQKTPLRKNLGRLDETHE